MRAVNVQVACVSREYEDFEYIQIETTRDSRIALQRQGQQKKPVTCELCTSKLCALRVRRCVSCLLFQRRRRG